MTALVVGITLAGCTANPPPPVESTDSPKPTTAVTTKNTVVVAIDEIGLGFNPHLLSDQSPVNSAVSSMVLPSPFRPVPSPTRPGGTDWLLDDSLLVSADVTSQAPFTITYQLRNEAQWSDSAPIAAEDFRYLWQQMTSQPGVVDPAGYALIDDIGSSGGGKTVTVIMRSPYPAWRELFTDLLPSHLVKDSPGGFARGLAENIPVSGAHFHIKSIDRGRDEILLERNDRFWGRPATADQILMRRGGSNPQLADSIRSGDAQIAQVRGAGPLQSQLAAIPQVRAATAAQPRVLELTLNGRIPALADQRVRRGLFGMLSPDLLAAVGTPTGSNATVARAQVLAPSDPGYAPTAPPPLTREQALGLLGEAGWVHTVVDGPDATEPARIMKDGKQLAVVIGAPENDDTAVAVANTAADQLRGAGVNATVTTVRPDELYGKSLVGGKVDAVVGWVRAGSDPATSMASRFGCPPPATPAPAPEPTGAAQAPTVEPSVEPNPAAPSNISGLCDPALQVGIDEALRGTTDVGQAIAQAEPRLWDLAAVLPLLQDATVEAVGPDVQGVTMPGAIQVGVFGDAEAWSRKQR
ncbi:ABC transporter family substrate-binding protein [Rhodococcus spelaei]|uniref:ABC transporter family substrate-binding protein n=1 Tax=Rhodococcus spelaei TaxID=2546320 RepID=A0A541BNK7_9NOCA|nr:ABC transporter family substrate-binding protein [Rhodococcus spelaei]TQF73848.1 ABC transporter family substrate-binding protein [Rhodococcus spelaei]